MVPDKFCTQSVMMLKNGFVFKITDQLFFQISWNNTLFLVVGKKAMEITRLLPRWRLLSKPCLILFIEIHNLVKSLKKQIWKLINSTIKPLHYNARIRFPLSTKHRVHLIFNSPQTQVGRFVGRTGAGVSLSHAPWAYTTKVCGRNQWTYVWEYRWYSELTFHFTRNMRVFFTWCIWNHFI